MAQRHIPVQKRAPIKRLIAVGLAVTLSFVAICAFIIVGMADRDHRQARIASANLVATLAANIARNFEVLDLSLQAVVDAMKLPEFERIDPVLRNMILFDRSATAQDVGSMMVLDNAGNVVVESRSLMPRQANYAERDYFKYHRANTAAGAYISRPWVTKPGVHVLGISRRLVDAKGEFNGVVVAVLKLSYFHNLLKDIRISEKDNLSINRTDGTILMRFPFDISQIGGDISRGRIISEVKNAPLGSFETYSATDNVHRLVAFHKAGNWPVVAGVGRSIDEIYVSWRVEAWSLGLIVLALCVSNIALLAFLAYSLHRRAAAERELAVMATTDGLTGLCNRRRFDELLDLEWRRASRSGNHLALLLIDVDHFKKYNDQFGHHTGDAVLVSISRCIAANTRRATDVAARFGGEEFAILLCAPKQESFEHAERIRAAVLALPVWEGGPNIMPTVSIGVAVMSPGTSPADLVKAADKALYEAKATGRNRSVQAPVAAGAKLAA